MDTRPFVEHLKLLAEAQRTKIEVLRTPLAQAEKDLEHILGMLDFYSRNAPAPRSVIAPPAAVPVTATVAPNLRGLSHKQAVITIAKFYGGVIKAQHAKQLMIEAGVMSKTKNSTRMAHNAIINSDRFERIAPGEFRLKPVGMVRPAPTARPATTEDMARMIDPSKPIQ